MPLFPSLSLFEGGCPYEASRVAAVRRIERWGPETGLDRMDIHQWSTSADCVLELAGCKLERGKERIPRITGGKFTLSVDGKCIDMCIDAS